MTRCALLLTSAIRLTGDRREVARKRKFDQWFAAFASATIIKQEGQLADTGGLTVFIAAIWQANHPPTKTISSVFQELSDSYSADKPELSQPGGTAAVLRQSPAPQNVVHLLSYGLGES